MFPALHLKEGGGGGFLPLHTASSCHRLRPVLNFLVNEDRVVERIYLDPLYVLCKSLLMPSAHTTTYEVHPALPAFPGIFWFFNS